MAGLLAVLVILNQIFVSLTLLVAQVFLEFLEVSVLLENLVDDILVLLDVFVSGRINCFEKCLIFLLDLNLLLLLGIDLLVDSSDFFFKLFEFLLISELEF